MDPPVGRGSHLPEDTPFPESGVAKLSHTVVLLIPGTLSWPSLGRATRSLPHGLTVQWQLHSHICRGSYLELVLAFVPGGVAGNRAGEGPFPVRTPGCADNLYRGGLGLPEPHGDPCHLQ